MKIKTVTAAHANAAGTVSKSIRNQISQTKKLAAGLQPACMVPPRSPSKHSAESICV